MTERLFSTYQIAKLLGTTLGAVAKWMDTGSLNFCRMTDGTARITESALIDFLTEQGIDLGDVLAKAGYTKVSANESTTELLPQTIQPQTPVDPPVETQPETQAEIPEEAPIEAPEETPEDTPEEAPEEAPEETPEETQAEIPEKALEESPEEAPEDIPAEAPEETPEDIPAEEPEETPEEAPEDIPAEEPEETPEETPEDIPAEEPEETPEETPEDIPAEEPEETPVEMPEEEIPAEAPPTVTITREPAPEDLAAAEIAPEDESPDETPPPEPVQAPTPHLEIRPEQACNTLIAHALRNGAQTILITPQREHFLLQQRVNGVLQEIRNFEPHLTDTRKRQAVDALFKRAIPDVALAALTVPCNAEFSLNIEDQDLTLQLSAIPTVHGPRLVIHVPSPPAGLDLLGLEPDAHARLEDLLNADGLIVVASKRRTGRDLTLQSLLTATGASQTSTIAIGRHPAADIDNVSQVQVDPNAGLTYSNATSAIEHQDADTILLTELRDPATAMNAFDAAHDGALVIAGTNATSAGQAICELLKMGVEPWPLGGTLKAVVEQASVPVLCEHCKRPAADWPYEPAGCDRCDQTGWAGSTVLTGLVFNDGQLPDLIRTAAPCRQIDQTIAQTAPGSLAGAAKLAVAQGVTTPAQAARILRSNSL
jgi:type II secretory ATPase GspE/PulE/Tfp pilus assembly ATPase PilB-like protein